jgi:hypothetical protein
MMMMMMAMVLSSSSIYMSETDIAVKKKMSTFSLFNECANYASRINQKKGDSGKTPIHQDDEKTPTHIISVGLSAS